MRKAQRAAPECAVANLNPVFRRKLELAVWLPALRRKALRAPGQNEMSEDTTRTDYRDYGFRSAEPSHMHRHFLPRLFELCGPIRAGLRVLDVGCGNGFTCGAFLQRGCRVVGVDLSETGIALARQSYPQGRFEVLAAGENLLGQLNEAPFDVVISSEVIEHLYAPRPFVRGCFAALHGGGGVSFAPRRTTAT